MCDQDEVGNAFANILTAAIAVGVGVGFCLNGLFHNSDLAVGFGILSAVGLCFYLMSKVEL